ncbi:hypothetical protein MCAL160_0213 [Mycoplasmopsis californica HAZ160_1]|uniref:Uncharacterized protein n=1 Tax=Mycoplasmopsis californica HAZ160_1 TaxID=1397850 RepID=A0AAT9F7N6_9BACT|nr:hypothetical protein [Mycoplasmopsis californica]BAP00902.1 hypothetical protein MCAL160_0213 [Mycoplasmopsis californica HAZ160_1]BBG40763.1 hypothetical protein MCAL106_0213 [Mycoplasmopsis californica]BBG41357.1 hypothetical protein MCAL106E_0213 [Mycoplasmopsis californica]BBG41950.1 hypothetical protein MCAL106L_0213 [Mycoplasmopsis californica]BBG42537.1 hypothetical protein MCAL160E_0213 [Mycoplasmopsis californica]
MKKLLASLEAIEAKIAELKKEATPEELKEVEHYLAVAKELERVKGVANKIEKLGKQDPVFREILEKNPELLAQLDQDAEYLDELVKNDEEFKDLVIENKIKNSVDENSLLLLDKRPELKELILENPELIKSKRWVDSLERLAKKEGVIINKKYSSLSDEQQKKLKDIILKEQPSLYETLTSDPKVIKNINKMKTEEDSDVLDAFLDRLKENPKYIELIKE